MVQLTKTVSDCRFAASCRLGKTLRDTAFGLPFD